MSASEGERTHRGSARHAAGAEAYTATNGALTFAAGETSMTVSVPILDDALDEGRETFVLKLKGARGMVIADGEATGNGCSSGQIGVCRGVRPPLAPEIDQIA